mmetsp:Transcript_99914/g.188003  ORF Transcript_99914/g.188003 Transcript_99914/m.188003 type:complete len:230 (+) Transcript_99914:1045-1734(+)
MRETVCARPYVTDAAAPVDSWITFLASPKAFSSSVRADDSTSKFSAAVMHSCSTFASEALSSLRSLLVTVKSPDAVAFCSLHNEISFFAALRFFLPSLMASVSDCFSISKLCWLAISALCSSSRCAVAFSRRSFSVSIIPPLELVYTAPAGAPMSSSSSLAESELCKSAVNFAASAELKASACTMAARAWVMSDAPCTCSMEAPPWRSRMAMARSSIEIVSSISARLAL